MVRLVVFLFVGALISTKAYSSVDSLRLEKEGDQYFIIHQVDEKETLYSLSRRYGVPIPKILEFNEAAKSGLGIGEVLKIPYVPRTKDENGEIHVVKPQETLFFISRLYDVSVEQLREWNELTSDALNVGQRLMVKAGGAPPALGTKVEGDSLFHIVKPSETLYAIGRNYEVQVLDLRRWNNLQDNNLSPGQKLFVGMKASGEVAAPVVEEPTEEPAKPVVEKVTPPVKEEKPKEEVVYVGKKGPETVTNSSGYTRLVENGMAGIIEGSDENRKYLALHSSAKIGTIMQIRNEMNNKVVFVRVLGRLPDTGSNAGLLIRLSKAAYDRLGAIDKKFRVEISYVP